MEIKVLTLNCWGLVVMSKDRYQRMCAIAEMLSRSQYDVVCLQEVWLNSDYKLIKEKVSKVLPYSHYFYSGVIGSGICILSRYLIEDTFFHQWAVNGYIHKIHHGDWFGGKGVGLCRLRVNNYIVNVYSAHLHAEYHRSCDEYQAHRVLQAFDTAQFIQVTSGGADLVILAGDLNTEPGDLTYKLILSIPDFIDAFTAAGNVDKKMFATNESLTNSYTALELIKNKIPGKRIDYILYNSALSIEVELKHYELPLPYKVPNCSFSYSDHEAVAVTLVIKQNEGKLPKRDLEFKKAVLDESIEICTEALRSLDNHKYLYFFFTTVLFILLISTFSGGPSYGFYFIYHILKIVITFFMFYNLMMATIWNKIERHAVIAAKLGMETILRKLNK